MKMFKKVASIFAMLQILKDNGTAYAQRDPDVKKSETKTLEFTNPHYGYVKFSYYTYQEGQVGLPLSYMRGKLEVFDHQDKSVEPCDPQNIDWSKSPPECEQALYWRDTIWNNTNQLRIAMEFGEVKDDGYKKHREQLRFIKHVDDQKWDKITQSIKSFAAWSADDKKDVWKFITIPEDDANLIDRSNNNGFRIIGGTQDQAARKATVEFVRPFDVSRDDALTLEGGQKYQLWLQWGVFKDKKDDDQQKVKGMRTYVQKRKEFPDSPGILWEILTPPPAPVPPGGYTSANYLMSNALWISLLSVMTYFSCSI